MARSSDPVDPNWEHVLDLLRSKNDNSRFAGLLLVTKCVAADDDAKREEVFHAVGGVDFLLRLLLPLRQGRMHPTPSLTQDEVDRQVQLAGLGLSIVSNLCTCEAVTRVDGMTRVAEVATDVLRFGPERLISQYVRCDETGDLSLDMGMGTRYGMVRNACDCAYLIFDKVDRQAALAGINIVERYDRVKDGEIDEVVLSCLRSVLRCCLKAPGGMFGEVVSRLFVVRDVPGDETLFELRRSLEVLAFFDEAIARGLAFFEGDENREENDDVHMASLERIRAGLRSVLASRPPETPRYQTLRLSNAISRRSIEWLVEDLAFFELLVQTVRVEIGVLMLDAVQLDAVVSDMQHLDVEDGDAPVDRQRPTFPVEPQVGRQAKDRALENLPVCWTLFEVLIDGLCDASAVMELSMDPAIGRIFDALTESAELMLQYVELAADEDDADDRNENSAHRSILKLGAFRGFCAYASQNPLQFQDRLLRVLEADEFPVCLALPALYGVAVVHGRPISEPSIVLRLMDEAARSCAGDRTGHRKAGHQGTDVVGGVAAKEVLLEVLLHALRDVHTTKLVLDRVRAYPLEYGVDIALDSSSSEDEQIAALAIAARCFSLCPEHGPLLHQLIQLCLPNLIEIVFSTSNDDENDEIQMSPLVEEMFDALLAACNISPDIARLEVAGNTLSDLCTMFETA